MLRIVLMAGTALAAGLPAAMAQEFKIGFITTLSGPGAGPGTEMQKGFQIGLKHEGWSKDGDKLGGVPTRDDATVDLVADGHVADSPAEAPAERGGGPMLGPPAKHWAIESHSAARVPSATRAVSSGWRRCVTTRQKSSAGPVTRSGASGSPQAHASPLGATSSTRTSPSGAGRSLIT